MTAIPARDLKILVTGGQGGIGAAAARLLAAEGAKVLIGDLDATKGEAVAREIGGRFRRLDVTREEDWQAAVAEAEEAMGGLNALLNNAGIVQFAPVDRCEPADFRRVIDVNLTGVFLGMRACVPAMRRAGGGVIVNVSSTAGLQGYAGLAAYVSSKWAVRGLTKASALDLAHDRIRVLSLHPGPIRTPMTEGLDEAVAANQPIPRYGDADEVARMIRFMISEASYSTGSEFVIDGGAVTGQVLPLPSQ